MDIERLSEEVGDWSDENFGEQPADNPLIGAGEEAGELTTCVLKRAQGIADSDKYEDRISDEEEKDAVADIVIYLADLLAKYDTDPEPADDGVRYLVEFFAEFGHLCEDIYVRRSEDEVTRDVEILIKTLRSFCDSRGYDFEKEVEETWEDVSGRDWTDDVFE